MVNWDFLLDCDKFLPISYWFHQEEKYIICKQCKFKIAKFDSLFPMSKEGIRTNFCNSGMHSLNVDSKLFEPIVSFWMLISGGFIHDTHTLTNALPDAVKVTGDLTSEFCWFPGYMWRYVHCTNCSRHLGWKYFSRNLIPRSFLGLSGNSIYFDNVSNLQMDTASTTEAESSADEWWTVCGDSCILVKPNDSKFSKSH